MGDTVHVIEPVAAHPHASAAALRGDPGAAVHIEYRTPSRIHERAALRGPRLGHHDRLTSDDHTSYPVDLHALLLVLPLPDGRRPAERTARG
ncbi:hypothetical protein [Kitasatospora sp. NPDC088783]|uniref:hypothetical protein n=1 Tax=Kitasatospora sp. NPDC088783 TaxID=3364077 RepID=UPI0037F8E83E